MDRIIQALWQQPARIVILSFLLVSLVGAGFLMLPLSTASGESMAFLDALFTATSAVCVTGLIVVDTPVYFSTFGHIVILVLIQIGGLGIMAFSLATVFLVRKRLSVGETELLSFMLNEEDRVTMREQLVKVILLTFSIEFVGALLLIAPMSPAESDRSAIWLATFHSVSAFCNAGFSLFSDSLVAYQNNVLVNMTISGLIIAGGLGFVTLTVLGEDATALYRYFFPKKSHRPVPFLFRSAPHFRYIRSESSRIALRGTAVLLFAGWVFFYLMESNGALAGEFLGGKYLQSFFQSVTLRTAGFNTVDVSALGRGTLLVMVPFMFIGAASGGTAGGIKLGTVATIWSDLRRFVSGRKDATIFFRRVPRRTITQAYMLVVAGVILVFISLVILVMTEGAPLEVLLFETVSALGTVGLSAGITGDLSAIGKGLIIMLMFLGRLGPLTLVVAFRPKASDGDVRYPDGVMPIG